MRMNRQWFKWPRWSGRCRLSRGPLKGANLSDEFLSAARRSLLEGLRRMSLAPEAIERSPAARSSAMLLAAAAILLITMGVRQSMGLFVNPPRRPFHRCRHCRHQLRARHRSAGLGRGAAALRCDRGSLWFLSRAHRRRVSARCRRGPCLAQHHRARIDPVAGRAGRGRSVPREALQSLIGVTWPSHCRRTAVLSRPG